MPSRRKQTTRTPAIPLDFIQGVHQCLPGVPPVGRHSDQEALPGGVDEARPPELAPLEAAEIEGDDVG